MICGPLTLAAHPRAGAGGRVMGRRINPVMEDRPGGVSDVVGAVQPKRVFRERGKQREEKQDGGPAL